MADVHGFYTAMISALKDKGYFEDNTPHKLIVCGDLFDRGSEAKELQRFILELLEKDEVILIKGNHEDLALDLIINPKKYLWDLFTALTCHHYRNRTMDTFFQLTGYELKDAIKNMKDFAAKSKETPFVKTIIPAMCNYFETSNYIFVHGWIPCVAHGARAQADTFYYKPDWRSAKAADWDYSRWHNGMLAWSQGVKEPNKAIICGHWHTSYGHSKIENKCSEHGEDAIFTPFIADGIIALDACTAHSGFVNCVVIDERD
ncbi:MAG: metallophosphoesterase [Roseburia sp.]|nr:metallophosphoesterase [Roseburia sp.]